jgi:hypothetical protein
MALIVAYVMTMRLGNRLTRQNNQNREKDEPLVPPELLPPGPRLRLRRIRECSC